MTRFHYVRAAEIIRSHFNAAGSNRAAQIAVETTQEAFVAFFRSDNPRFDVSRFRAACERADHAKGGAK